MLSASSCSERDDWFSCISRTVQEYYKAPTVSAYNNVELRERLGMFLGERPPSIAHMSHVMMCMNCGSDFTLTLRRHHCHACGKIVCRSCSRNKYPLKYLKDRPSKVCNGCYAELRKRELAASTNSSPQLPRSSSSTFTSMLHSFHPSAFKRHKKVPSALMEVGPRLSEKRLQHPERIPQLVVIYIGAKKAKNTGRNAGSLLRAKCYTRTQPARTKLPQKVYPY